MTDMTQNDIDTLMDKLVYTDEDIAQIVALHRQWRAGRAKGRATTVALAKGEVDLTEILGLSGGSNVPTGFVRRT